MDACITFAKATEDNNYAECERIANQNLKYLVPVNTEWTMHQMNKPAMFDPSNNACSQVQNRPAVMVKICEAMAVDVMKRILQRAPGAKVGAVKVRMDLG